MGDSVIGLLHPGEMGAAAPSRRSRSSSRAPPLKPEILRNENRTAASALKMAYAAWTKGSAALILGVRALARAEGVEDSLLVLDWADDAGFIRFDHGQDVLWTNSSGSTLIVAAHQPGLKHVTVVGGNAAGWRQVISVITLGKFVPLPGAPSPVGPGRAPAW
jgi:hypothetical protein